MAAPNVGFTDSAGSFGTDSPEIIRGVYIRSSADLLETIKTLLGDVNGTTITPHRHPLYTNYACHRVNIRPIHKKSVQGSSIGSISSYLDQSEKVVGYDLSCVYKPLDTFNISDETLDVSAQVMSLQGNTQAGKAYWRWAKEPDTKVTHTSLIAKVIPKIEVVQKRIFQKEVPSAILGLVGSVNKDQTFLVQSWNPGTLLITGVSSVSRWSYDGLKFYEWSIKGSAIKMTDSLSSGTDGVVTWNHLYNVHKGWWDKVYVGKTGSNLIYKETDMNTKINKAY